VVSLQSQVANVAANFKDVLEVRTKNIQASRSRQDNFVSSVSARSQIVDSSRSESPLYQSTATGSGMGGRPQSRSGYNSNPDLLSIDPSSSSSALTRGNGGQQADQQLLMMEEAQPTNTYIQQRGEAIESIERTINELGSIFGQLAGMVSEVSCRHSPIGRDGASAVMLTCDFQQSEMIQRIDANTEVSRSLLRAPIKGH
jgi:syntaxin 5